MPPTATRTASEIANRGCLNVPGRQRHSERAQKARLKFPHATATKTTVTGKPQVTVFAPGSYKSPVRTGTVRKEETARARGTADRGTARHPAATRGSRECAHITRTQTTVHARNTITSTPQEARNT